MCERPTISEEIPHIIKCVCDNTFSEEIPQIIKCMCDNTISG